MGSLSSGFDAKEQGGILKRLAGDEVSLTKDRLYGRGNPELNKCFIEITGTRYNGSFLLRLNKDVDESIYRTMKQIENTGGLQKRDKSLPRKGLSSVLKCLTQPVGTADDAANEGKSPLSMLKRTKRKFSYRPVRQISSPRKPDPSRTELQNDEKSQHDLIGGILDIFKSTLAQFKSSGGYATVEKGPQGREAIVLHEAESSASSTVPKEGKVRIRFPKESLLVLQPPKPIADSPNKDEYELSIEVKPPSIARYASQTIKLAKDKILIGMKDGEGIMQINEPPTKRSFHMTIEEDVKGKPCVKVNVTESKNPNENRYHDSQMVIEGPAKCDSQEHNPVNDEDEKGKPTKLSSEENLRDEEFSLPDRISPKNLPQPERLPPDFNARQAHYKKPFHDYCHFRQTDLQLPEFRELNHPEGENRRYPILVTELFIPRPSDNEAVANSESGKMNSPDRAFVTSPPELSCEKQNSTLSPRFQPNDGGSRPQTPSQARSVNGEAPNLHSPIDKRPMECQKQYVKMGGRVELRNTERRTTWSTTDRVMPPHHEPGPHWPTAGKNVSHFYSSMKLRKEIASICHYPSNRELGESYPESLPSKFWDFCLTGRDSNEGRFRTQAFGQYGPRNNHSCSCRNKIPSFSESEDPINPDPRPAPPPPEIARDVKSSSSDGPKQDKNTISVVNLALCGNYRNQHISGKNVVDTKNKKSSTVAPSKAKWTFPKSSGDPLSKPNTDTRITPVNKHHPRNRESDRARRIEALTDLSKPLIGSSNKKVVYKELRNRKPKTHVPNASNGLKTAKQENTFMKAIRDINGLLGRQISRMFKLKPTNKSDNRRIRT